jgi:branched-subunit amino acid transport protein
MSVWLTLLAVGAVTFLLRASFIVFADPHRFPHLFRQALAFVPPSVLPAIVAPGLLVRGDTIDPSLANPRWIAGLVAIVVAARTRSTLATVLAGMGTLWLLQWAMR